MEKTAEVSYPKTKCEFCAKPVFVLKQGVALCESCSKKNEIVNSELFKSAHFGGDYGVHPFHD